MWDPRNYEDTDYGLEPGESFEPEDVDSIPDVDVSQDHIMTILGPISPDELGVCLHHEHVIANPVALVPKDPDVQLTSLTNAQTDLEAYLSVGGRSVVDITTQDYGRDLDTLLILAQHLPMHLIAATGRDSSVHAIEGEQMPDRETLAQEFVQELSQGAGAHAIRPGVIAVATSEDAIAPGERTVIGAAVEASRQTGVALILRPGSMTTLREALSLIDAEGYDPGRLVTVLPRDGWSRAEVVEVVQRGGYVSFGYLGASSESVRHDVTTTIIQLAEAGYPDRIVVSQGSTRRSQLMSYGGDPGLTWLMERFTLDLMEVGASAQLVRDLLVTNVASALTIVPVS